MPDNLEKRERPILPKRQEPPSPNSNNVNDTAVSPSQNVQSGVVENAREQRVTGEVRATGARNVPPQGNRPQNRSQNGKPGVRKVGERRPTGRTPQMARRNGQVHRNPQNVDINKVRKEIEEEDKKQEKAHKKLIIFIVIAAVIIAGLLTAFVVINVRNDRINNMKLDAPVLHVNQLYNGTALNVDSIPNATKYEYVISDSNGKETKIDSTNGYIELNTYLNQAGIYGVKVRAYGKGPRATSDFSEVETVMNYVALEAPRLFVNGLDQDQTNKNVYTTNSDITNDKITWNAVPNASKYRINYGVNLENDEILFFEVDARSGINTFQLSDIYTFGPGAYIISVVAVPARNSYYLSSIYTYDDCKTIKCYLEQKMVQNAEYDKQTKTLSFGLEDGKYFDGDFKIVVGYGTSVPSQEFTVLSTDVVTEYDGNFANYEIDLSGFINNDGVVSVMITTLTNSTYGTNSGQASATIINWI